MTQGIRKQLGITLLEVLLVLAIASMIIVMSIRYYQSAVGAQGANTILEEMQAITAAMDNLATASGSYTNVSNPASTVQSVISVTNISSITASSATQYSVKLTTSTTTAICNNLTSQVSSNPNLNTIYTGLSCGGGTVSYTYSQPTA
jgi:type II secretory pathway pseudopilin PulG